MAEAVLCGERFIRDGLTIMINEMEIIAGTIELRSLTDSFASWLDELFEKRLA